MSNISMFTFSNTNDDGGPRAMTLPLNRPEPHDPTLSGYDLVWAVTPETLRTQLAELQLSGRLPTNVLVGNLDEAGLQIGGDGDDSASIAVPELRFDTSVAHSATLVLTFIKGNMRFYNGYGNKHGVLKQSIAGWKLAFTVKLQLGPIALQQALARATPACAQRLARFDESQHRLQAVTLDFERSDLMHMDPAHSRLDTDNHSLATNFVNFIGAWLKGFAGAANPFVLAYAATRMAPGEALLTRLQTGSVNLSAAGGLNLLQMLGRRAGQDVRVRAEPQQLAEYSPGSAGRMVLAREVLLKRFLKPMLLDPIQERLSALPDYRNARVGHEHGALNREESFNEKSGVSATLDNGARAVFVANAGGWGYRDHVLLHWREGNRLSHVRESEQDLQFSVTLSTQPDNLGVPRLTVDLYSSVMRYEWDRASQKMALFNRKINMGKGWARCTMHWSLRLQFVAGEDGVIRLKLAGKKAPVATDSGVVGMYVVSDALAHLLNMNKLSNDWDNSPAGLLALQDEVAGPLGEAATALFEQFAAELVLPAGSQPGYRNIQLNRDGNIELELGSAPAEELDQ
jgi:hypothetical protein